MRLATALSLAAALLPCAAAPQSRTEAYRASGTEPFWALTIDTQQMRFEPLGGRTITVATPKVIHGLAGDIYRTLRLSVNVVHRRCSDGMSDRDWPDTVTVQAGGRTWQGCGGAAAPTRSRLEQTRWTVWQINDRAIAADRPLTVNFTGDRIEGRLCNAYGGPYRLVGARLTVGSVIATRMACGGAPGLTERTLFRLWQRPVTATVSRWGTLTLRGGRDVVTLRPVR